MTIDTNSNMLKQTHVPGRPPEYQTALDMAEAGQYEQAFETIQEYLITSPNDAEAINDTGAILHCMGKSEEAINHFKKARTIDGETAEIVWNLVEAHLAIDQTEQAVEFFHQLEKMDVLNAELLNRTANIMLQQDELPGALDMLNWSLRISPDQEILHPMIEVINGKINEAQTE